MIDCHCHLEQPEFDTDRDEVIQRCKKELKAIITSCTRLEDLKLTLDIVKKYRGFIFCCVAIHPEYINETNEEKVTKIFSEIEKNKPDIVGIGETGLDFFWVKEKEAKEKQERLFLRFINFAKKLRLPIVVHSRNATDSTLSILEQEGMKEKKVLLHLFNDRKNLKRVIDNGWFISIGPGIKKSKEIKKIARDMPLDRIMLETDSPWFAQEGQQRGLPTNVKIVAEIIAEIKKLTFDEVEKQTDINAIDFFNLNFNGPNFYWKI